MDIGHLFTYLSGYWILLLLRCWDIGYWALAASGYWLLPHSKQSNIQRLGLSHTRATQSRATENVKFQLTRRDARGHLTSTDTASILRPQDYQVNPM